LEPFRATLAAKKMNSRNVPYCTLFICLITLVTSFYVAIEISGTLFGKIRITQLENFGAVTLDHIKSFEVWRLLVSQFIHVKQLHMIYNVLSLLLLGVFIERYVGFGKFFILWFVSGAAGTLFSTLFVAPPWNLGTGASQAIMGVAGFGVLLVFRGIDQSKGLKYSIAIAILPALILDLIFAHYPKPGHILGFIIGISLGIYYLRQNSYRKK